jgi:hypothetical protein
MIGPNLSPVMKSYRQVWQYLAPPSCGAEQTGQSGGDVPAMNDCRTFRFLAPQVSQKSSLTE